MRLCSVAAPRLGPILCVVGTGGELFAVGTETQRFAEVAQLLSAVPTATSLESAIDMVGTVPAPLGLWQEVELTQAGPGQLHLLPPIRPTEVWAAGVTYERSLSARVEESHEPDIYERVYRSARPELFFKATGPRLVGPNGLVGLRSDSRWQVPEPELAIVIGPKTSILGYTLANDMSSRDIEGENPLYLPQAKIYAGSCAIGPVVVSAQEIDDPYALTLSMRIVRREATVFQGRTSTARLHVKLDELVSHLRHDNWVGPATVLLTGTGVVPEQGFTLEVADDIEITCPSIGTLRCRCAAAGELPIPPGWS